VEGGLVAPLLALLAVQEPLALVAVEGHQAVVLQLAQGVMVQCLAAVVEVVVPA
jgi:hypothetical protein